MRRASLVGADLSFADLTGANLSGADLDGAKLANTIWTDGKTCKQTSVGRCIKNF
ncbi:MAG: pentapeptide repeat-containing protein [Gammaproteobacteria bacterium]|nr:pentapeptide repeat-containing protein [Gammaproteobacteria bacterium]